MEVEESLSSFFSFFFVIDRLGRLVGVVLPLVSIRMWLSFMFISRASRALFLEPALLALVASVRSSLPLLAKALTFTLVNGMTNSGVFEGLLVKGLLEELVLASEFRFFSVFLSEETETDAAAAAFRKFLVSVGGGGVSILSFFKFVTAFVSFPVFAWK